MTGIIAQLGVFLVGAYFVLTGRGLTAGGVILFVNLMNFMIEPVTTLPALLAGRRAALGLMDQLADALAQHGTAAGQAELAPLTEGIRMEHVSFSYEPGREVLHDVSTTFEAGKAYAVVGGSGSGKSTLLNLLMAAGDYQGSIRLDGTELRDVLPESLHAVMSVIQQNVFVFNASIRDNVTMFRAFPQDALDDAIAHAHLTGLRPNAAKHTAAAKTASGCRAAKNSASPSPGRCSKSPPSCWPTRRPPRWTRRRRIRSRTIFCR